MPKETVYGSSLPYGEDDQGVSIVEVGWDREAGHMQIATKCVRRTDHGRMTEDEAIHFTDGFYVDLDRRGINDLIRNLRRARDQAFGRDE